MHMLVLSGLISCHHSVIYRWSGIASHHHARLSIVYPRMGGPPVKRQPNRRSFLKQLSLAGLAAAAADLEPTATLSADSTKDDKPENKGPLANLPGAPGPTVEKIKGLADNTWLNLDSPAADPKWGKGRGRSWSSRMAYAPDLKAAFLFGEGVHVWWNKQNNRYMDDLFVYDIPGHRWVCAYPGTDVTKLDLKLDKNGFEVDEDGRPVPVAQLGHAYENLTYDSDLKRFMFMPGASADWQSGPFGKNRMDWGVKGQGLPRHCSPWIYDVQSGRWDLRKVEGPSPARGATTLGMVIVYVPARKKAFFWDGSVAEAWLYDPQDNTWSNLKFKGPGPAGIDKVACLDPRRERIYMGGPKNLWCYDLKANAFIDLDPKGKPPQTVDDYIYGPFSTSRAVMNYDSANDVLVVFYHGNVGPKDAGVKGRGIFVYDPAANVWGEAPGEVPRELCKCPSSFYDPELNAHFIHCAGDSADDGIMLAYRYKRANGEKDSGKK
jgi:hypothetical protein